MPTLRPLFAVTKPHLHPARHGSVIGRQPGSGWRQAALRENRRVAGSRMPELDVARARRWCAQRVPAHLRNEIRVECDIGAGHLTIVECRPPWRKDMGETWTRFPIARLRYTKAASLWSLYWRDRHLRFHLYDRLGPSPRIEELLQEVDRDPTSIFWG